ncbi:MAG: hypothetical protein M3Q93_02120, partial [Gemmatimonadota bacterium]|nr:hypothetical protein [Gemmatimonadota bacterium]
MALSEIEKLERRYAENPQGLTFAPLAEVHRKTGAVPRALELLRLGLTLHPDYIPASIVLGRCHLDLGDLAAAEAAFAHVLELDAENVIALKALADITERHGRFDDAERWLSALLLVDRSNDEARDQLGRVGTARRQTESAAVVAPVVDGAPEEMIVSPESTAGLVTAETPLADQPIPLAPSPEAMLSGDEPGVVAPVQVPEPRRDAMAGWASQSDNPAVDEPAPLELQDLGLAAGADDARPEGIQLEEPITVGQPVTLEAEVEPLAGLVGRDPRPDDTASLDTAGDFRVEMAEDIVLNSSGGGEFQVANASEELLTTRAPRDAEPLMPVLPPIEPAVAEPVPAESTTRGLSRPESSTGEPTPAGPVWEDVATEAPIGAEPPMDEPAGAPPAMAAPVDGAPAAVAPETAAEQWAPEAMSREPLAADPVPQPQKSWTAPVAEPPRRAEPELVVTESMAELLLRQGHPGEALTVYRHLESRREGDPRFLEKIAELERVTAEPEPSPARAGGEQARVQPAAPESAAPAPAYSVLVTHGRSVQALLRGVLASR